MMVIIGTMARSWNNRIEKGRVAGGERFSSLSERSIGSTGAVEDKAQRKADSERGGGGDSERKRTEQPARSAGPAQDNLREAEPEKVPPRSGH